MRVTLNMVIKQPANALERYAGVSPGTEAPIRTPVGCKLRREMSIFRHGKMSRVVLHDFIIVEAAKRAVSWESGSAIDNTELSPDGSPLTRGKFALRILH